MLITINIGTFLRTNFWFSLTRMWKLTRLCKVLKYIVIDTSEMILFERSNRIQQNLTERMKMAFLENVPIYIPKQWRSPYSPGLNSLDYSIWRTLKVKIFSKNTQKFGQAQIMPSRRMAKDSKVLQAYATRSSTNSTNISRLKVDILKNILKFIVNIHCHREIRIGLTPLLSMA